MRAAFNASVHHSRSSIMVLAGASSSASPAFTSPPCKCAQKRRDWNVNGRPNWRELKLYRCHAELLDAASAHGTAITHKGSCLAVPLPVECHHPSLPGASLRAGQKMHSMLLYS
jgi:hypothetical protein